MTRAHDHAPGLMAWRRLHRATAERTPELRADPQKYRRMEIARAVRVSDVRGDVTLAAIQWGRER